MTKQVKKILNALINYTIDSNDEWFAGIVSTRDSDRDIDLIDVSLKTQEREKGFNVILKLRDETYNVTLNDKNFNEVQERLEELIEKREKIHEMMDIIEHDIEANNWY